MKNFSRLLIFSATLSLSILPLFGQPSITSFTPIDGEPGTVITLNGTNFSANPTSNIVYFGATKAQVNSASNSVLSVTVPYGASYSPISVTVAGLTGWSTKPFIPTFQSFGVIDATSFESNVDFTTLANPLNLGIADLDGDGKIDMAEPYNHGGSEISVFRNTSTPGSITQASSFSSRLDFNTGPNPLNLAIGDIDCDGKLDIAVANWSTNTISVLRNTSTNGTVSFANKVDFTTLNTPWGITIGDLDGDGKPDLVVACKNAISILRNTSSTGSLSSTSFSTKTDYSVGEDTWSVALSDLDNAGGLDIVIASKLKISIFRNTSIINSISLANRVDITTTTDPGIIAIGDLDDDGKTEIAVLGGSSIAVYRNTSVSGTLSATSFSTKVDLGVGGWANYVAIGDLNGDGKPDIVSANSNGTISILRNKSTPSSLDFYSKIDFTTSTGSNSVAIGDLDNDGKPDLAISNQGDKISILRNIMITPHRIDSFIPDASSSGSIIDINGAYFDVTPSNNVVKFNGTLATVTTVSDTNIKVKVPSGSSTGKISITIKGNTVTSSSEFLVLPLTITSFSPGIGASGTSLTITGTGFSSVNANNTVKLNGVTTTVTNSSPTSITVIVPAGNTAGKIKVTVNGTTATSTDDFGGTLSITSFTPTNALVDGTISITGTGFSTTPSNQTVKFNGLSATVTASTLTSLTVKVPTGATTGKISITRETTTATSATEFLVLPLTITSFSPGIGASGTSLTITGTGFSSVNANNTVKLNGVATTVTNSSPTSITVIVPAGNTAGKIKVTVNGTTATSTDDFGGTLSITSFTPTNALVDGTISITGTGFSTTPSNQTVKFNGLSATVTASTLTSLTVKVPTGATTGKISITRETTTTTSASEFLVLPLTITSFSPSFGAIGNPITITGTGFSSINENNIVKFNGITATVTSSSPTSLTAIVPNTTKGKITVTVLGQTATSMDDFMITKLAITLLSYSEFYTLNEPSTQVSVTVNDINEVQWVHFKSKGITQNDSKIKSDDVTFSSSGNTISFSVPASYFTDPLGLNFSYSITEKLGNEILSPVGYMYLEYPSSSTMQIIPDLKSGKNISAYQLIAIPLELKVKSIDNVFNALKKSDNRKWRLFSYENEVLNEKPSLIETGKGYWFIMRDKTEINPGDGTTVKVTPANPYTITLKNGWNLIGNPYNFTISWNDVVESNSLDQQAFKFRQFRNGKIDDEPLLNRYRGAFVYSNANIDIKIPVINHSLTGNRSVTKEQPSPLDAPNWQTNLTVNDGEFENSLFGFGMNPKATEQKDSWDETSLPILEGLSSFSMNFREVQNKVLIKDVVNTQDNYTWQASLSSNHGVTLQWDNSYFGDNDKQLILENTSQVELVDMRKAIQTSIPAGSHILKFHFGDPSYIKSQVLETTTRFGKVYPNPVIRGISTININVSLPEGSNTVSLHLMDLYGSASLLSGKGTYDGGRSLLTWQNDFSSLTAGIYLLKIEVKHKTGASTIIFKKIAFD